MGWFIHELPHKRFQFETAPRHTGQGTANRQAVDAATKGGTICEITTTATGKRPEPARRARPSNRGCPFTQRNSGKSCSRGCVSWPVSLPAPTCGGSHRGPSRRRHRTGELAVEPFPDPIAASAGHGSPSGLPRSNRVFRPRLYHETRSNVMPCKALRGSNFSWTMEYWKIATG